MEHSISGHTKMIALLGRPVGHSMSPAMQNESFRLLDLDYCYLAFDVGEEELDEVVRAFRLMDVRGMNITMPCKNRMAELCDELSPEARFCGAVNTVVNENSRLTGYSTDGTGFLRSAEEHGFQPSGSRIVLFGTGGAASSVLTACALAGAAEITVFGRPSGRYYSRAQQIAAKLRESNGTAVTVTAFDDDTLKKALSGADLLVNATSVGMASDADGCLIPDESYFHKDLIVADAIYEPRETKLVRMARSAGLTAFGGLDMLLYQGDDAFRLWTGKEMPVAEIRGKFFPESL